MNDFDPIQLAGYWMSNQKDREQRMRRMALANNLMDYKPSQSPGALESVVGGVSKGLGQHMFLKELSNDKDGWGLPGMKSGGLWSSGFGEASFGPDKIGIRDGIRGLFGLPK